MPIPSGNILNLARRVIAFSTMQYHQFMERQNNAAGKVVASYYAPVTVKGSLQPVPQNMYMQMGLDYGKDYEKYTSFRYRNVKSCIKASF